MVETAHITRGAEAPPPAPFVELRGAFDARAARNALEDLRRYAGAGSVLVDFSKVNFFQDFALDLFVQELSRLPDLHLQTRGLPGHPVRILQYLHIDPHTLTPIQMSRRGPDCHPARKDRDLDD
jgi:anti-anti-sigma regulatory factor